MTSGNSTIVAVAFALNAVAAAQTLNPRHAPSRRRVGR